VLNKTSFFRAVTDAMTLPKSSFEVIFAGRSNVGKSAVINSLCGQKNLARTSKTPGRTRSVNIYSVEMGKWLVDLPGYGFARVNPAEKALWQEMAHNCIVKRQTEKTVFVVIDGFIGPTELDFEMFDYLKNYGIDFRAILNKCDKIPKSPNVKDEEVYKEAQKKASFDLSIDAESIFALSARKQIGIENLRKTIEKLLHLG
jgi:GTP-binding protein